MKSPDAMEHMTLKDNFVGHRMVLVWPSVTNDTFGKSSNENYQMNQCRAIIKKLSKCITQYKVWCYAWVSRLTLTTLEKRALSQNNIRLQLFLRHGAKTINVFRACLGAQLTICAQKWRNFVLFSTASLRFILSRVCVFLYSLGPWCNKNV